MAKRNKKVEPPNLVVLTKEKYTFFNGRKKLVSIAPIDKEFIEEYRKDPEGLMMQVEGDANRGKKSIDSFWDTFV